MGTSRYYFRLIKAFISRFKLVILLSVFLGAGLFLLLNVVIPRLVNSKVEKIAVVGRYTTTQIPFSILSHIGEGLTHMDSHGIPQPALAKSWETTDNGKTWKFELVDGKVWQDGTPVTSQSIQYSFENVEIQTPDPKTIIFKLIDPFSPFPTVVSKPTFKKGLLGSGKWKVTNITLSGGVVSQLRLSNAEGHTKLFRFYPTQERAKLGFKLGHVDQIIDLVDAEPFSDWPSVEVISDVNEKRFVAVFFNLNNEAVGEKTSRQALSYAIDKTKMPGVRAISNIWPGSWAYNGQTKPYDFDQERAKELLEGKTFSISLATTPLLLEVAEQVAQDWRQIGVDTTVQVVSTIPADYQAYLAIYDVPTDPDQYATWHSTQNETNITHYKNPRVDTLLEEGRQELNLDNRKKIYLDFQRFLLEDSPLVILYHPYSYNIIRK